MKHRFLLPALLLSAWPATGDQPNIILMLSDDQGWDGLSVAMDDRDPTSKSDFHQTPSLEKMAAPNPQYDPDKAAAARQKKGGKKEKGGRRRGRSG